MALQVPPRVLFILAKDAPIAVVIARVRAKLFHISTWDYVQNVTYKGADFKGQFYFEKADISFDGKYLVYFAVGPWKGLFSWTAVCEPPHLTATMFWEQKDTWTGGGVFLDDHTLWLDVPRDQPTRNAGQYMPSHNIAKIYTLQYREKKDVESVYKKRLIRDGWISVSNEGQRIHYEKTSLNQRYVLKLDDPLLSKPLGDQLIAHQQKRFSLQNISSQDSLEGIINENVLWADWGLSGLLLASHKGEILCYDLDTSHKPVYALDCNKANFP